MESIADKYLDEKGNLMLWIGLLLGPSAWFLQLEMNYALVPWVCASGHKSVLIIVSVLCLLLTVAAGLLSLTSLKIISSSKTPTVGSIARALFMARLGILMSSLFALVIIAQSIPNFILSPCAK
jgi:hypothetical protein